MKFPLSECIKNEGFSRGTIVRSKAGHDKHELFIVLRVEDGFAYLADGRSRPYEKPKKKRLIHLRPLGALAVPDALDQIGRLGDAGQRNAALRKLLINFFPIHPSTLKEES